MSGGITPLHGLPEAKVRKNTGGSARHEFHIIVLILQADRRPWLKISPPRSVMVAERLATVQKVLI